MRNWLYRRLESFLDNLIFAALVAGGIALWAAIGSLSLPWIIVIFVVIFVAILGSIRLIMTLAKRRKQINQPPDLSEEAIDAAFFKNKRLTSIEENKKEPLNIPTTQKQSWSELIQNADDGLLESVISAKARAERMLEIGADADIINPLSSAHNIIWDAYDRYGVAVKKLKKERSRQPHFKHILTPLINSLLKGQSDINSTKYKKTLGSSKSKVDENTKDIIRRIESIVKDMPSLEGPTHPQFVWLSEQFFLGSSLVIEPAIRINTLKLVSIQSISLEIDKQQFQWDQGDTWVVGEPMTIDDIKFELPLDVTRGKQLARLITIVDGEQRISNEFIIDLPRKAAENFTNLIPNAKADNTITNIKDIKLKLDVENSDKATGMEIRNVQTDLSNTQIDVKAKNVREATGLSVSATNTEFALSSRVIMCSCGNVIKSVTTCGYKPAITCPKCGKEYKD